MRSRGGVAGVVLLLAVLSACAMPWEMDRARPLSGYCPQEIVARQGPVDTTALRWYRVNDDRDLRLGDAWCGTVGDPEVRLTPSGTFPPWAGAGAVRVVTWNVNVGGGDLEAFLAREMGLSCGPGSSARLSASEPFVLLLQEVWRYDEEMPAVERDDHVPRTFGAGGGGSDAEDIIDIAERCGLALVYVPSARNGPDTGARPHEDKGNAILSTLPLSAPIAFELPFEAGRKVAVGATTRAPGGQRVRFVSAHLDVASTFVRTVFSGNQTRARQARALIDGVDEAERDGPVTNVVVVGGDFNTWAGNESALLYLRRAFPDSPRWEGLNTRGSFPTDHMFFRRGSFSMFDVTDYGRIEERHGSDHHGRDLRLTFQPPVEGPPGFR